MTTFRNIKRRENNFGQQCSKKLYAFIKKHPVKYPSDIKELMDICGLECDFDSVKVYQKFHAFLQKHREYTDEMFGILIADNWFDKYHAEGLSDKDIYDRLIDTCISWEIIPLYHDSRDGKYKLVDLPSFLLMKQEGLFSATTSIKNKAETYQIMEQALPDTIHSEMERIKSSPVLKKLRNARNELNRFLPEGKADKDKDNKK
jgi:hypothetical protein